MTIQWLEQGVLLPVAQEESPGEAGATGEDDILSIPKIETQNATEPALQTLWAHGFAIDLFTDRLRCYDDFGATARLAWSERGLVVGAEVVQRAYSEAAEGVQLWRGDSVEVVITGQGVSPLHLAMAPGLDSAERAPRAVLAGGAPVALTLRPEACKTSKGYRLAIVIPWSALGLRFAEEGIVLNTQIYINQRPAGMPKRRLAWYPYWEVSGAAGVANIIGAQAGGYPVRLSEQAHSSSLPFQMIATANRGEGTAGGVCIVHSTPSNDGVPLEARYNGKVVGGSILKKSVDGRLSVAEISFLGPEAGERWRELELWADGQLRLKVPLALTAADYHSAKAKNLIYQKGEGRGPKRKVESIVTPLQSLPGIFLHRVELTGLEADTVYSFGSARNALDYSFRTMPKRLTRPLNIVVGGDTLHRREWMEEMNRVALSRDPDFIVWGGDLADTNGEPESRGRWQEWFGAIASSLMAADGRVIPIIPAVGNHDVRNGYFYHHSAYRPTAEWRKKLAPEFYELFAFPGQPGYGVLDFGDYCSLLVLDTDHTNPIAGRQTEWLKEALRQRVEVPWVFPIYHIGAYPAVKDFEGRTEKSVREHWVPLFERFNVRFAFEHHNHAYKRTHAIRKGMIDPTGIVYMGDGGWGVATREPRKPGETWYLERSLNTRHATFLTLDAAGLQISVLDSCGREIDSIEHRAAGAVLR